MVQNMVGSCDLKTHIRLSDLALAAGQPKAVYEPETFPGLRYRPYLAGSNDEKTISLIIFASGICPHLESAL